MKLGKIVTFLTLAVSASCLCLNGCGGGTGVIAITVGVSSSLGTNVLILGQSTTLTATVTGATNTSATWDKCMYTTTPVPTTAKPNPVATTAAPCIPDPSHTPSDPNYSIFGSLTNEQTTTTPTATFTAPATLPDQTIYPNLVIIITAVSVQETSKSGFIDLSIDSGIEVSLTPTTAAVPINEEQPFIASLTNDLKAAGVTWLVTQSTPVTPSSGIIPANPYMSLATCSVAGNATGCGSIDANGVYTAPTVVPTVTVPANTTANPTDTTTPSTLTVVATSKTDTTRFALATITVVPGGPISFNGISPTIAPQGAFYWDIYLNAPNISSASQITITGPNNNSFPINSATGQVKVLFPIPTTAVVNPGSTGARIRLFANDLNAAGPYTVVVTDQGEPVTTCTGNPLPAGCTAAGVFTYNVIPVRPTAVASVPADVIQGGVSSGDIPFTIDGGYFGNGGTLAQVEFNGNTLPAASNSQQQLVSSSKQLLVLFDSQTINAGAPGLYSLSLNSHTTPAPFVNNPAVTDLAVFPNYSTNPPTVTNSTISAGTNPSAIDIDPTLGVIAVAQVGSDPTKPGSVQFYSIGTATLTPLGAAVPVGKVPTGLSINRTNHTVAVVNYQDQSVTVLQVPGAPIATPGVPFTLDISGVLQGQVSPAPFPYSIGVDPDTNQAVVAYSSSAASTAANVGFLLNLNAVPNPPFGCLSGTVTTGPCVHAQVTMNTGLYPQIAMAPHGHLAFVTPGGSGVLQGVDVTKSSASAFISSLTLAAGIVTATTTTSTGLVPGNSGTVLISGVPLPGAAGSPNTTTENFNGVYSVAALSDTSFTFIVNNTSSGTVTVPLNQNTPPVPVAQVFYSNPNLIFGGLSQTTQGIAINPITNTAALADANATGRNGAQINLINNLDQTISSISFFATCTFYTVTCADSAELLGTADIAWQPYSNSIVSYNPGTPGLPVNQISVSDPVSQNRYAITQLSATGGVSTITVANGTTNSLTLFGGLAVDPATNQAFVVDSALGIIDVLDLGPCKSGSCPNPSNALKPTQITEILVPSPMPGPGVVGGIPGATMPQGTLTSTADLANVQIFGSGFDATTVVRLDAGALPAGNVQLVSSRQLLVTIPASFLSFPHRYALDAITQDAPGGPSQSNATDFIVIQSVDLSKICTDANNNPINTLPSSVAVADQLANGPFGPIAVVTNSGCNNISVIDTNPTAIVGGQTVQNPNFGKILNSIAVGMTPQGIAVSQPFGLAVIANNGDGTASVVDLTKNVQAAPAVSTGTNPTGVAINDATGAAIVTNPGSNTITEIDLGVLFGASPATTLTPVSIGGFQQPTAVAIDPDRGTNNQGIAVVTALELENGAAPAGALQVVDIGLQTPALSTTINGANVTAPTTGIVFDPTVITGSQYPGVFYASSSGGNVISQFNPDSGANLTVNVGINPTALALNPQTGAILTTNVAGNTISLVDTTAAPLKSVKTFGISGSPQFGVAIDQFTNLAFIVDQGNNRLLIFPVPN